MKKASGHPLTHGGTSRDERMPAALAPETVQLDDRRLEHLLVWMQGYARELAFHGLSGKIQSHWGNLLRDDESMLAAEIRTFDIRKIETRSRRLETELQGLVEEASTTPVIRALTLAMRDVVGLCELVHGWRDRAAPELPAARQLGLVCNGELAAIIAALRELQGHWNKQVDTSKALVLHLPSGDGKARQRGAFEVDLFDLGPGLNFWATAVDVVLDLYRRCAACIRRLTDAAPEFLEASLQRLDSHRPDLALLVAFLQLYQNHAQRVLNQIPRRHLDFYYQRVLGLQARPAQSDHAYIVVELARHVASHRLAKGTRLLGNDAAAGAKVQFELDEELVANRARIAQLASLYIRRQTANLEIFAAPHANSADGQGSAFPEGEVRPWHPFGWFPDAATSATVDPPATTKPTPKPFHVGLAIASPMLRMAEGARTLRLTFSLSDPSVLGPLRFATAMANTRIQLERAQTSADRARQALLRSNLVDTANTTGSTKSAADTLLRRVDQRARHEQELSALAEELRTSLIEENRRPPSTPDNPSALTVAAVRLSSATIDTTPANTADVHLEAVARAIQGLPEREPLAPVLQRLASTVGHVSVSADQQSRFESHYEVLRVRQALERVKQSQPKDEPHPPSQPGLEAVLGKDPNTAVYELGQAISDMREAAESLVRGEQDFSSLTEPLQSGKITDIGQISSNKVRTLLEEGTEWIEDLEWLAALRRASANRRTVMLAQGKTRRAQDRLQRITDLVQLWDRIIDETKSHARALINRAADVLISQASTALPNVHWALSTERGWLAGETLLMVVHEDDGGLDQAQITIELSTDDDPIVPVIPEVHTEDFTTDHPVLRLHVAPEDHARFHENDLRALKIEVECRELRNLVLHTPVGPAKPDKPVMCFGPAPRPGAAFLVGSWEVFQKRLQRLQVRLAWQDDLTTIFQPDTELGTFRVLTAPTIEAFTPVASGPIAPLDPAATSVTASVVDPGVSITVPGTSAGDEPNENPTGTNEIENLTEAESDAPPESAAVVYRDPYTEVSLAEFEAELSLLHGGQFHTLGAHRRLDEDLKLDDLDEFAAPSRLAEFDRYVVGQQAGFVRLRLRAPLQHAEYPRLVAQQAVLGEDANIPNPPWTPVLESISLTYTAVLDVELSEINQDLTLFHVLPFGHRQVYPGDTAPTLWPTIKATSNPVSAESDDLVGALHIGISNLEPNQNFSFLLQVAEGSADPDIVLRPHIYWSYLAGDRWVDLPPENLVFERTRRLLNSGLVRVLLPSDADTQHSSMPSDLRWLRASVTRDPNAVSELVDVHAQVVRASFVQGSADTSRLARPLPALSLNKLVESDAAVKAVSQPYASRGGMVAEQLSGTGDRDPRYDRRIHERLRHKGRAITVWDYERLVLEHFPEVYRVKCLPHTDPTSTRVPGEVSVIVVAHVGDPHVPDPTRPRASHETLARIREFLIARASPHLATDTRGRPRIHVSNPKFTEVHTKAQVMLRPGLDPAYWTNQLQVDLRRFMAPWAFDAASYRAELSFGGRIPRSAFVDFIRELDYVDVVVSVALTVDGASMHDAIAEAAHAILVPTPRQTIELAQPPVSAETRIRP